MFTWVKFDHDTAIRYVALSPAASGQAGRQNAAVGGVPGSRPSQGSEGHEQAAEGREGHRYQLTVERAAHLVRAAIERRMGA